MGKPSACPDFILFQKGFGGGANFYPPPPPTIQNRIKSILISVNSSNSTSVFFKAACHAYSRSETNFAGSK